MRFALIKRLLLAALIECVRARATINKQKAVSSMVESVQAKKVSPPRRLEILATRCGDLIDGSLFIPKSITVIPDGAFEGCHTPFSLTFEDGGTSDLTIGNNAFADANIAAVEIPK